jgi:H+-transporting ATPase
MNKDAERTPRVGKSDSQFLAKNGLSTSEAEKRLREFGSNEIPEKKTNIVIKFLGYFWGPIPWMIEVAVALSAVLQHWDDFGIILALLLLNAVVGFWQENKADNAIELLKQRLALKARVLRDGKWREVEARELVPGDVVRVRLGDIVPADIKLMDGDYVMLDESALTGESLPVEKHVSDVCYAGSIVRQGEMNALVVGTGINTYFGKTTRLVQEAKTQSHFQKAVVKIGNYLIILAVALVAIIFTAALLRHEGVLETLQFALVLIVAAVPVALPAVLTVTMAVGAIALAKKEAIVSKLVSIEEMAGVDILFSDKTGTITKNELTVGDARSLNAFKDDDVILLGVLASKEENHDPIDDAIIAKAKSLKAVAETLFHYKTISFRPFDPVSKRTEAMVENGNGSRFKVTKGAPQVILSLVADKDTVSEIVDKQVDEFAEKGHRALGVAKTDNQGNWQFVGLLGLYDPPREDSAETIRAAQSMGVNVKMVTGDHIAIAKEISHEVNLGTNVMLASSFLDASDSEAVHIVENADGFAEVFPEHKYRIVELLQKKDHIVGMTGDGVNDAPALKKADAGIAVSGAVDAAKSAADVVLTKSGLSIIIDAIKESRKIFERMNNYAIYRMAETIRVLLFLTLAILVFDFYPVTAVMLVILAILNDLPIMTIAFDNAKIREKPVGWNMNRVLTVAAILGVMGVFSSFLLFWIGMNVFLLDSATLQTFIFLKLAVAGHMTIYLARTGDNHFWVRPLPGRALFFTAEATQLAGTFFAAYGILMKPIGWALAGFIWGFAMVFFVVNNFVKVYFYRATERSGIFTSKFRKAG